MTIDNLSDLDFSEEIWKKVENQDKLKNNFEKLSKITDKWGIIRQVYMENISDIMAACTKNKNIGIDPYFIDWADYLTPIQNIAWTEIRSSNTVFYPQFPLFNNFIDFANPYLKIGIELDVKESYDPIADKERNHVFAEYGWKIFRITEAECFATYKSFDEIEETDNREEEIGNWMLNTCSGVIHAISQVYFTKPESRSKELLNHTFETLSKHQLATFDLDIS